MHGDSGTCQHWSGESQLAVYAIITVGSQLKRRMTKTAFETIQKFLVLSLTEVRLDIEVRFVEYKSLWNMTICLETIFPRLEIPMINIGSE